MTRNAALALEPMPTRRTLPNEQLWKQLYPFAEHYCQIGSQRLHYLDEYTGNGSHAEVPTLLLVHGNPTWSFHWRQLILAHRDHYRCVAPDHLGCGYSDLQPRPLRLEDHIENLLALIAELDLQKVTLVAQDWGGAIGLGALQQQKSRFERIVLLNTGAFKPWFIPWRIGVCRWPVFGKLALQGANAFSRAALRMTLARSRRLEPSVEAAYLAPYDSWQRRAAVYQFVQDIPLSPKHPTWDTLAEIEASLPDLGDLPSLLVWGMQDWCFTPECLVKFQHYWPQSHVKRIEDAGHWVMEDAPDEVLASLADFLNATSAKNASVQP